MNKKQRANLARYAYDLSKIMVAVPMVGNALSANFSLRAFWLGFAAAISLLLFGFLLDRRQEDGHEQP
ncbi:MAG: hypothetical protein HZA21_02005 [Nitrospirae bacterium]|nr:hypothetical protein [Nitrospirota bacterium]